MEGSGRCRGWAREWLEGRPPRARPGPRGLDILSPEQERSEGVSPVTGVGESGAGGEKGFFPMKKSGAPLSCGPDLGGWQHSWEAGWPQTQCSLGASHSGGGSKWGRGWPTRYFGQEPVPGPEQPL